MRKGEPLSLEEMQERQAEMEDRLNAMHAELQDKAFVLQAAEKAIEKARALDLSLRVETEKGWFHTASRQHSEVVEAIQDFDSAKSGRFPDGKISIVWTMDGGT